MSAKTEIKIKFYTDLIASALICIYYASLIFDNQYITSIDAYYHFKLSHLMWENGLFSGIDHLPLTILGNGGADPHYLFHLLLMPFAWAKSFMCLKIATWFFLVFPSLAIYFLLRKLKVPYAWFFIFLLICTTAGFAARAGMLRAQSIAIPILLILLLSLANKKYLSIFIFSLLFSWTYHAHIIFYLFAALSIPIFYIKDHKIHLKSALLTCLGLILGQIINPFFPESLKFLYSHTLMTKFNANELAVIPEWYPATLNFMLQEPVIINILLLMLLAISIRKFKKLTTETIFIFTAWLIFMLLTSRHGRFMEYWLPLSVFLGGLLLRDVSTSNNQFIFKFIIAGLTIWGAIILPNTFRQAEAIINKDNNDLKFKIIAEYLATQTKKNEIIINLYYDDFPFLFYNNHHNRYVTGLNPSFLYEKNPQGYLLLKQIRSQNMQLTDLGKKLNKQFNSCWLVARNNNSEFLLQHKDLRPILKTKHGVLWKINHPNCTKE